MSRDDWNQIGELFHRALRMPESEREPFLMHAASGDLELVHHVLALLEADRNASPLDQDLPAFAPGILAADQAIGTCVGRYRIDSVIGRGGMGVVYRGIHVDLETSVAIKVLPDAWVSPSRRERFAQEVRMLARLNHPHIARLYDADSLPDGTPYFVMEYVDGEHLMVYCRARRLSIGRRLALFRSICEAVQHAHRHAIVHRDLKPSNVLVKDGPSPGRPDVKLLDFGIAANLDQLTQEGRTSSTMRLMTPAYAAPEQLGGRAIGVYTDVYALGLILYELLTDTRPFDTDALTPAEVERLLQLEPKPPSRMAASRKRAEEGDEGAVAQGPGRGSWAELDTLCLTALHVDPSRRYPTVEALIRDLDHFQQRRPLEARAPSWTYRTGKFIQRHRASLTAAAAAVVLLCIVVIFYGIQLTDARDAAVAEMERTRRVQTFMMGLFRGEDEAAGPSDTLRVITMLERGIEEARVLEATPDIQADLLETLGLLLQERGDFSRADSLLRGALESRRKIFEGRGPDLARSIVLLGLLRLEEARFDEADSLLRAGLAVTRQTRGAGQSQLAEAVGAYGRVLQAQGAYDEAVEALEEAIRLLAPSGASPELSRALSELANTHFYAGRYGLSDSLNQLALRMDQETFGRRHPAVAGTLVNLAATRHNRGYYEEAERLYRQALEIYLAYYGADHLMTASNMVMLAQAVSTQDRPEEALALLRPALAVRERRLGPTHPRVATTLNELGTIALRQGAADEAEVYFNRMVEIYRSTYGDSHHLVAIALSNLASVHRERDDMARAEDVMRDVLERFLSALSADHVQTGIARLKLGRVLLQREKLLEAEEQLLAGYELLASQLNASSPWVVAALSDLAKVYDGLGDAARAQHYRALLADAES